MVFMPEQVFQMQRKNLPGTEKHGHRPERHGEQVFLKLLPKPDGKPACDRKGHKKSDNVFSGIIALLVVVGTRIELVCQD